MFIFQTHIFRMKISFNLLLEPSLHQVGQETSGFFRPPTVPGFDKLTNPVKKKKNGVKPALQTGLPPKVGFSMEDGPTNITILQGNFEIIFPSFVCPQIEQMMF